MKYSKSWCQSADDFPGIQLPKTPPFPHLIHLLEEFGDGTFSLQRSHLLLGLWPIPTGTRLSGKLLKRAVFHGLWPTVRRHCGSVSCGYILNTSLKFITCSILVGTQRLKVLKSRPLHRPNTGTAENPAAQASGKSVRLFTSAKSVKTWQVCWQCERGRLQHLAVSSFLQAVPCQTQTASAGSYLS